jgi:hypothetical protein
LRLVIAAASNGGGYANLFRGNDTTGILETVLAELWDFDTRISSDGQGNPAPQDYLRPNGKPLRAYTQTPGSYNQTPPNPEAYFLADLTEARWSGYYDNGIGAHIPAEIPPLPPGPYNSTGNTDGANSLNYRHHLIRDFMFLDAAASNHTNTFPTFQPPQDTDYPYNVVRMQQWPPVSDDPKLATFTQGIGHNHPQNNSKYLLEDSSFVPESGGGPVNFEQRDVAFTALLYELRDSHNGVAPVAPNWFGVAVPDGNTDMRNVILYFHPNPTQTGANYSPSDYQNKSGQNGTNWKELFAYVDRLGFQLAGAAKYAGTVSDGDPRNQIVIFPFMQSYDDVGILPKYWYFIIKGILDDLYNNGVGSSSSSGGA